MAERTDFELVFTFANNQVVRVSVDYEEDQGLGAIQALRQAGSDRYIPGLFEALRDDPSILAALDEQGMEFYDEDDTW